MPHELLEVRERIQRYYAPQPLVLDTLEAGLAEHYGANLRWIRRTLGWSQQDSAQAMDVSVSQYRKYERGQDFARMSGTARFMLASGVPFPYQFVGTGYEYLFEPLHVRADLLSLQAFCGRCDEVAFNTLVGLLSRLLNRQLPVPEDLKNLRPPRPDELGREVDGYYRLAADALRQFRELVGLTQETLANLLQVCQRTLSRYEQPCEEPHFNVVMTLRLWAATGVAPLWMTYGTDFFQARMLQHRRMGYLCELMDGADPELIPELTKLVQSLMNGQMHR